MAFDLLNCVGSVNVSHFSAVSTGYRLEIPDVATRLSDFRKCWSKDKTKFITLKLNLRPPPLFESRDD